MKKFLFSLSLVFTGSIHAQVLDAKPIADLLKELQGISFTYQGRGKIFGFDNIQSCLFISEEFALFKNYCFPVRNYPARGYTIISRKFGIVDLYEERLSSTILKRDIQITQFPDILLPYLSTPFPEQSVLGLSDLIEKLHYQNNPACWSTNYSWYTQTNDVNCNVPSDLVINLKEWEEQTQRVLLDEKSWILLMSEIEKKLGVN
jgi:hypothetical protein